MENTLKEKNSVCIPTKFDRPSLHTQFGKCYISDYYVSYGKYVYFCCFAGVCGLTTAHPQ